MPSAPSEIWARLRATRAAPSDRAAVDPRRSTYAADMEQFEELMKAAEQVRAPARPLPLFTRSARLAGQLLQPTAGSRGSFGGMGFN